MRAFPSPYLVLRLAAGSWLPGGVAEEGLVGFTAAPSRLLMPPLVNPVASTAHLQSINSSLGESNRGGLLAAGRGGRGGVGEGRVTQGR